MVSKALWNNLYIDNAESLPWVYSETPKDIMQLFTNMLPGNKQVLDFGCGEGRLSKVLKKSECIVDC